MTADTSALLAAQLPRVIYLAFCFYAVALLATRWPATRVMTVDRRFLLLFFALELATTITSGLLKLHAGTPADIATWLTVLTQSFLTAYLHYSIPARYRRPWHWITRRRRQPASCRG